MDGERLRAALCALAENAGGSFEPGAMRAPFCIDPNSPEIRTLTNTYNELANRSDCLLYTSTERFCGASRSLRAKTHIRTNFCPVFMRR